MPTLLIIKTGPISPALQSAYRLSPSLVFSLAAPLPSPWSGNGKGIVGAAVPRAEAAPSQEGRPRPRVRRAGRGPESGGQAEAPSQEGRPREKTPAAELGGRKGAKAQSSVVIVMVSRRHNRRRHNRRRHGCITAPAATRIRTGNGRTGIYQGWCMGILAPEPGLLSL